MNEEEGKKAQVAALSRDYILEPHLGARSRSCYLAWRALAHACAHARNAARNAFWFTLAWTLCRLPDRGRRERAPGYRRACQGKAFGFGAARITRSPRSTSRVWRGGVIIV